ncbi:MAG: hypothetical protein KAJ19_15440 [Gammaproteobacteria bacterium]|nr:hypothetical protein [Gammaproteobacteria bacterium]
MATLAVQVAEVKTGVVPTYNAVAGGGDEFVNNGRISIHVRNAHGADPRTITINSQTGCNQESSDHDIAVVITAANDEKVIGPFPKARFDDANDKVQLTYSDAGADLTIALMQIN